jgi:hypothetical protein
LTAEVGGEPISKAKSAPLLPFTGESAEEILSQLISASSFTVAAALRATDRLAISEPNKIELVLNSSLDFQKKVLERPEHRAAIQQSIKDLTGVQATISVGHVAAKTVSQPAPATDAAGTASNLRPGSTGNRPTLPEKTRPPAIVVRDDIDPNQDAFVQDVVDVFGATVDRVINAPAKREIE